jgi:PKD repeat protein
LPALKDFPEMPLGKVNNMKIKRIILPVIMTLSVISLFLFSPSPAAAAITPVSIEVVGYATANSDFIAKVNIGSVTDFDACNYDVTYDPAVLQVTDVTDGLIGGTIIPVSSWGFIPLSTQGSIRVIQNVEGTPGVTGAGYLAEIHFHVVGAAGNASTLHFSNGILGDKNALEIQSAWTDGSVEIVAALSADFSISKTEALTGEALTFTSDASGGMTPYTYSWDFNNDGVTDNTTANPTYSYATAGTYTVKLTIIDSTGNSKIVTKTGYVTIYTPLSADFSADKVKAAVGETITFTGAPSGGKGPYTYSWDFNNSGTTENVTVNPNYNYMVAGTYTVKLTITDSLGGNLTSGKTDYVTVYNVGDANSDGVVNALDITYVEHIIMEDTGYVFTTWADAKADKTINALDITEVELIIMRP